ncbi:transglutaminase family protein [Ponticaulis sp.]|uniref:transglutaminase family protein n=1 Tax=Ponticaulis sp. TaxID=2020902 RepID=UPI00261A89F5|nr:transglutaminase family protein [Ponticaulis sp.]MDF1681568.1 transglutaminase family protein [Ponticaulis sp.]
MTIRIGLTHRTSYSYDKPVKMGPQTIRLRPAPHCRTPIVSYSQTILPEDHFINWQQDPFGNYLARIVIPEKTTQFSVEIDLVADMIAINPFDFFLEDSASHTPFTYDDETKKQLQPYLETDTTGPEFEKFLVQAKKIWGSKQGAATSTVDTLVALNQLVEAKIDYTIRMEPGVQTPEETLALAKGSCRDSSWLLVNICRRLGLAARFVSGYLVQLTADIASVKGPSGPEVDFTDLHAWVEIYIPGAGWIGLDPTSGLFAGEGHIPLAATPVPSSAAPISGGLEPCEVEFDFEMKVERLIDPPRHSKPLSPAQSDKINVAGRAIDKILTDNDVRLTMGGEPTFVSETNRDAPEWTTDAVGPEKRTYADQLIRRLKKKYAPNGLLTHGQGKWYPGEPLPRWAFTVYWRNDGEPLWRNPDLIQKEEEPASFTSEDAAVLAQTIATRLDLAPECAQPIYEDPAEIVLGESNLPINLDPEDPKLKKSEERRTLARAFEQGLGKPKGFVIPLQTQQARNKQGRMFEWMTEIWESRRGKLFLVPGDSPAGFRLPLKSLPELDASLYPGLIPLDPFAIEGEIAAPQNLPPRLQNKTSGDAGKRVVPEHTPEREFVQTGVRTAMSVEHRDGHLCIFMPPVVSTEAFLDLIYAVEEAASQTGLPVRIEGYPPPRDPRISEIKVTPDPGVIEVNVQPTSTWDELSDLTRTLYEDARQCGLDSSTFLVNGRPTGSGGGAHIVMGGASPNDSPFLRRPDLLASIIRYWQNHPALSYFFAGTFIGPTSQAPRIDEARHDQLYEMELALKQLPPSTEQAPPWLVDRVLRHLLVDTTGNTHRSEICIDKLYSPDGPTGRLGLVEFRAFEMPPHAEMNLAQQLLLRALIAWFWTTPYTAPLKPLGTALNDEFMLPAILRADLNNILREVSEGTGVQLDPSWFDAHMEFRFPKIGNVTYDGIDIELRHALEQWNVLGEEGAIGGTARFVDSSLERIQVTVTGDLGSRQLLCNGIVIPLSKIPGSDTMISGVRFRTWLPASCLHPTIQPHGPLTFDLYDSRIGRSIGGCTYFPTHPGGRNFDTRPINALEAEGRRIASFTETGHTAGQFTPRYIQTDPRFSSTLDLRWS